MRLVTTTTLVNWLVIICVWNSVELLRQAGAVAVRFICRASISLIIHYAALDDTIG